MQGLEYCYGKNNKLDFIFKKSFLAFFYGIYLALYELQNTEALTWWMHPVLIVWATIILIHEYLNHRLLKNLRYVFLLAMYGVSIIISLCFRFSETGVLTILKTTILTIYPLLIFFSLFDKEQRKKELKITMIAALFGVMTVLFIGSIGSILMYLQRQGIYEYSEDSIVLFGLYRDSNHASLYALIVIGLCIFIINECKHGLFNYRSTNKLLQKLSYINIIAQACYFPLANSRGGWLSFFIATFLGLFLYFAFTSRIKKRYILSFLLSIILVFVAYVVLITIRDGSSYISTHYNISINLSQNKNKNSEEEVIVITSGDGHTEKFEKENEKIGAGRLEYWTDTVKLLSKNITFVVFGMSNQRAKYAAEYLPDSMLSIGVELHNSYLDIIASFGIFAVIPLIIIFMNFSKNVLKKACRTKKDDISFIIILSIFVTIVIGIFFISCAFITTTLMYFIILIIMSYLLNSYKYQDNYGEEND